MKTLIGHTSPETAYLVDDYPYGYTLRCKIRYWTEYSPKHGMRFCSQTTDPRKISNHWNKPKKGTYADLIVLYLDEKQHVTGTSVSFAYDDADKILAFIDTHEPILLAAGAKVHVYYGRLIALTRKKMKILTDGKNIFDIPREQHAAILIEARSQAMKELSMY